MTKLFTILFLQLVVFASNAQIWTHDFESAGGYSTSGAECTDGTYDYFLRTDGSDISDTPTGQQGSFYFAAQDIDGSPCAHASATGSITFDDIDISSCSGLSFQALIAHVSTFSGWDNDEYLHFDYDIDNSGTWTPLLWFENDDNGINGPALQDTDFDGIGEGTLLGSAFQNFTATIPGTGSLIDIRVTFKLSDGGADACIDNLRIFGSGCGTSITTSNLTGANFTIDCGNGTSDTGTVDYTGVGTFNPGNSFYVEISDASGNFPAMDTIGSIGDNGSDPSGTINITIPSDFSTGNYIIRIVSDDPSVIGTETSSFTITQSNPCGITTGTISGGPFSVDCGVPTTDSGAIDFTSSGIFNSGNTFTVELSDASGSFANPTTIGTLTGAGAEGSDPSGNISFTLPSNLVTGSNYLIRIISDNPEYIGSSSSSFTITQDGACVTPYISSIIINSCQEGCTEGHNEIVFANTGDFSVDMNADNFDFLYQSTYPPTNTYTDALTTNPTTTTELNDSAGCPGLFVEGVGTTIPPNAPIMLVRSTICPEALDWSSLCGSGPIYVVYTTDATWNTNGNFNNSAGGPRYFESTFITTSGDTATIEYEYNSDDLTLHDDGDYVTFSETGGYANSYGNNGCTLDPVVLNSSIVYFDGTNRENQNDLFWTVSSQTNTAYFVIEHSMDGLNWEEIAQENGHGTTEEYHHYTSSHYRPERGINYYMLYSVDYNGATFRKGMTSVDVSNDNAFYNSGNKTIYLHEKASIELYSLDGKLILKRTDCDEIPFDKKGVFILKDVKSAKTQRIFTY